MKKHTLGLSIATILLLAACGGGGSDDNSPADPNNGGSNNNTPSVPKISSPAAPTNKVSGTYQGKAYIIPVNGGTGKAENIGGNNIATPTISGQQIATEIPNISGGGRTFISNSNIFGKSYRFFVASGRNELPNSRFGYINEGDKDYIFSHGTLTTNMPTSGTAKYSGEAVLGRSASGTLSVRKPLPAALRDQKTATLTSIKLISTPPSAATASAVTVQSKPTATSTATTPPKWAVSSTTPHKTSTAASAPNVPATKPVHDTKGCIRSPFFMPNGNKARHQTFMKAVA